MDGPNGNIVNGNNGNGSMNGNNVNESMTGSTNGNNANGNVNESMNGNNANGSMNKNNANEDQYAQDSRPAEKTSEAPTPELPKQGKPSIFSWAALSEVFNFSKKPSSQVNGIVTPGGKKHKGRSRAKKNKTKKNKTRKNKKTAKKQ